MNPNKLKPYYLELSGAFLLNVRTMLTIIATWSTPCTLSNTVMEASYFDQSKKKQTFVVKYASRIGTFLSLKTTALPSFYQGSEFSSAKSFESEI